MRTAQFNSSNTKGPYVIVLGNEKGGTGKSTISLHLIVHLLRLGFKVGSIDIDARQGTLTRYIENRKTFTSTNKADLPHPEHHALFASANKNVEDAQQEERDSFEACWQTLSSCDFIVMDTPGNNTYLSNLAHSYADTLITPLNDSFIDLDVLVQVKSVQDSVFRPSTYAETVWEQKKQRLIRDKVTVDWIVLRNRLSTISARNKEEMSRVLELISNRLGFRVAAGFSERVIFRELFLSGLTLLDLPDIGQNLTLSHVAARQELRTLVQMIKLPMLEARLKEAS